MSGVRVLVGTQKGAFVLTATAVVFFSPCHRFRWISAAA
jgi:hypothetical protein